MADQSEIRIPENMGFFRIASQRSVMRRAAKIACIVGLILAAINHGDRILAGDTDLDLALRVLLTFCVPFCVSTYSSVLAIRERSQFLVPRT